MIGIGDFDGKSRNKRKVVTREGQLLFMGHKYSIEKSTGYYVCTSEKTGRKRLHVAMWEAAHGIEVPEGCAIHHLDWDKTHNTVDNLICVTHDEHNIIHNVLGGDEGREWGYELLGNRDGRGLPPGLGQAIVDTSL